MFYVAGKVALVTGGAGGIGLATVKKLLENGARGVTIADVDDEAGERELEALRKEFGQNKVIFIHTDVSSKNSFDEAFKRTLAAFKNIDILVNNAGIFDDINYEREIAINFIGVTHGIVLGMNKYIPKYKTGSEGVIINTASTTGVLVLPCAPIYGATKSAVVALTTTLGHKVNYDNTKVKILAIAPGLTDTNIVKNVEKKLFNEQAAGAVAEDMKHAVEQTPEFVGEKIIEIIQTKPSGTVWIVADRKDPMEYARPAPPYEYV